MGTKKKSAAVIMDYGEMWARNAENIKDIPSSKAGGQGVYILYDGSMPVYVGKGKLHGRVSGHSRNKRKKEMWDHFSWYRTEPGFMHHIEALLLSVLPRCLRNLNQQGGKFIGATEKKQKTKNRVARPITRKLASHKLRVPKRPK